MSTEENKANARRFNEEVWNHGNLAVVDELLASNAVFYDPAMTIEGSAGFKQYVNMYRSAFPDLHFTIEDEIAEGDTVVQRITARGTHQSSLLGIPPTDKQVTVTSIIISRLAGGKLVEGWANYDALGMMQQLGVIPAPGQ